MWLEPWWGVAGPGETCGGACTKANHALKVGIITGEANGEREAVWSGGMCRLGGAAGCEAGGGLWVNGQVGEVWEGGSAGWEEVAEGRERRNVRGRRKGRGS